MWSSLTDFLDGFVKNPLIEKRIAELASERTESEAESQLGADERPERSSRLKARIMPSADREERFNRLVREHGDAVYRYLRRRYVGGDATDAEDLLADVMSVAWRRLDDVPSDAELPWLFGVARRRLSNARTRRTRRDRIMAPVRPRGAAPAAEDEALADLSLREALASLPEKEREALTLTAWEGLDPEELALALGVSVNAAAIRLSKAKSKLLELLATKADESSPPVATEMQP